MEKNHSDKFRLIRGSLRSIAADYFRPDTFRSPGVLLKRAKWIASKKLAARTQRRSDIRHSTYTREDVFPNGEFFSYLPPPSIELLLSHSGQIEALTSNYLAHCFDLLGSGWVQVKHGMKCRGLEGYRYEMGTAVVADSGGKWLTDRINSANLADAQRIWSLVDEDYTPIDWHLDFKSGYRWSENAWYLEIKYGHRLGADIKVPLELARMQHLPQLTWAYGLAAQGAPGFLPAHRYSREFRNQVLDFVAANPPRFGVNWHFSMDVAIRVANWLVTYDLLKGYGAEFDEQFSLIFHRTVYQHGLHIISNLEWDPDCNDNHYLANIVGLLLVGAYLPTTAETGAWMAFAVQELIREVRSQFNPDGTNFEGSTSYHRLAGEMVGYATALILGLPKDKKKILKKYDPARIKVKPGLHPPPLPHYQTDGICSGGVKIEAEHPFPTWYLQRLEKMAEFTVHITKPAGHIPQIGDNDNGRFLKLQPVYHQTTVAMAKRLYTNLDRYSEFPEDGIYWDEDHLDCRHLVALINGLLRRDCFTAFSGSGWLETELIHSLIPDLHIASYHQQGDPSGAEMVQIGREGDFQRLWAKLNSYPEEKRQTLDIPVVGSDLLRGLELYAYPDFGLYLYRSNRLYLAIRCGPIGKNGKGGHAHNDQLTLELNIDGEDWILDPGTYLYTPLPDKRNEYRSVKAHFAPRLKSGDEPARLDLGLFRLENEAKAKCLYFGEEGFIGVHWGFGEPVYRLVTIESNGVRVIDAGGRFKTVNTNGSERAPITKDRLGGGCLPSYGYGCRGRWLQRVVQGPGKRAEQGLASN